MKRLAVTVEGGTEEEFVKRVLASHLRTLGIEPTPILLGRARRRFGGGNVSVERLASEMVELLRSFDAVTSFVDFYGFRRKGRQSAEDLEDVLAHRLRETLGRRWNPSRVIPYVQRHEFESLLFSNVDAFRHTLGAAPSAVGELRAIRAQYSTPEDINDSTETCPSRRIERCLPLYGKRPDGPRVAENIGLAAVRRECPRFDAWLGRLESIASGSRADDGEIR